MPRVVLSEGLRVAAPQVEEAAMHAAAALPPEPASKTSGICRRRNTSFKAQGD